MDATNNQQPLDQTGLTANDVVRILRSLSAQVPLEHAVWSAKDIADYLGVSARQVTERLSMRPDFPAPRRTAPDSRKGHLRWQAVEVIAWWEKQPKV
jgi:hypothetical protein